MKLFLLTLLAAVAASGTILPRAGNATLSSGALPAPLTPDRSKPAHPKISPWYFNILASDGTYLGQEYASAGAYLFSEPSVYVYRVVGTDLISDSSDVLVWSGDEGGVNLVQPQYEYHMTCRVTWHYPSLSFGCDSDTKYGFGNYYGNLVYGSPEYLKSIDATPITFTVVPCSC